MRSHHTGSPSRRRRATRPDNDMRQINAERPAEFRKNGFQKLHDQMDLLGERCFDDLAALLFLLFGFFFLLLFRGFLCRFRVFFCLFQAQLFFPFFDLFCAVTRERRLFLLLRIQADTDHAEHAYPD